MIRRSLVVSLALFIVLAPVIMNQGIAAAFTPVSAICTSAYEAMDGRCMNQGYFSGTVFEGTDGNGYGGSGVFQNFGFACPKTTLGVGSPSYCAQWNYVDSLGSDGLDQWAFPYTIDNGQPNAAQSFVNFIQSYLYYTDPSCDYYANFIHPDFTFTSKDSCYGYRARILGATFIILTMLGPPYTTYSVDTLFSSQTNRTSGPNYTYVQAGIADAKANFNLWSQEVLQADANGQVNWNTNTPTAIANSIHPNSGMRDYGHDVSVFLQNPEQRHAIIFNTPTGQYILNRRCGNTMSFSALAPPVTTTATCAGYITDVATPDPNQPFNLTVSVQFGPNSAANTAFGPDTMSVNLTGPAPYGGFSKSTTTPTISNGLASMQVAVPATKTSGTFNLTWRVSGSQTPTVSCSNTITVAYVPYFTVEGGDVTAGQGFGSNCPNNPPADISGENLDDGSSPANYFGAGTTNGAIATGNISQFATDTTNNVPSNLGGSTDGLTANQPDGLAFANNAPVGTSYGSGFLGSSSSKWCVPDYAAGIVGTTGTSLPSLNTLPASAAGYVYRLSGDQTLGAIQLAKGVHVTLIVSGNVYITGNITYAAFGNLADMPQFSVMSTSGSIYIDHSVKELHGFYDAQASGAGNNGLIFTCATSIGAWSTDYTTCKVPLTMYGAVSAKEIILGRTEGNVGIGSPVTDDPAERFVYTPELWLSDIARPSTSCANDPAQPSCMYQTYTNLPPIL